MTEDQFWHILGLLNWDSSDGDSIIEPAVHYLSKLSTPSIIHFQDLLSEKLHALDGIRYAENINEEDRYGGSGYFSADIFLYVRCWVVAQGKSTFECVLADPTKMPKKEEEQLETLLRLPGWAYYLKTGHELNQPPKFIFETGFNVEGWGDQAIQLL